MTAQREVNVLTDCETFIYSFRLAAKIMIDVLTDGQMREIYNIVPKGSNHVAAFGRSFS